MLAYAVRFNVDEIILFYPNAMQVKSRKVRTELTIKDALAGDKEISIKAFQLPIINRELLDAPLKQRTDLSELFEGHKLKNKIEKILIADDDL